MPLDGSEWHERAISYGLLLSKWFGSKLDLFFSLADVPPLMQHGHWRQRVHLTLDTSRTDMSGANSIVNTGAIHEFGKILATDYLNAIKSRLEPLGVNIATDLSAGNPAHILSFKAREAGSSLIVMYARPQARFRHYVRTKMAEELISSTTVPLLMVNEDPDVDTNEADRNPRSVIVPLRVESAMHSCLPYALAIAEKSGTEIQLLQSNVELKRNKRELNRAREVAIETLEASDIHYSVRAYDMGLTDALCQAHESSPSSWIVMGSRMRLGFTRRLFPSVADNVRREVSCPILAVPHAEIIEKREIELDRWLSEWRAVSDSSDTSLLFDAPSLERVRNRPWKDQIAALYSNVESDRRARRPRNKD